MRSFTNIICIYTQSASQLMVISRVTNMATALLLLFLPVVVAVCLPASHYFIPHDTVKRAKIYVWDVASSLLPTLLLTKLRHGFDCKEMFSGSRPLRVYSGAIAFQ